MSTSRDKILGRVQAALVQLPRRARRPEWDADLIRRQAAAPSNLWALFAERMKAVNGTPLASVAELVALLERDGYRHGYCDPMLWPEIQPYFPAGLTVETIFYRNRVDYYQFGITLATGAIAETGTVILSDGQTSARLGALAPWVHVAVLRPGQIHSDLLSAVDALPADPNVIWVTGPSKTADVEGILIEGVHGPGVQIALLLGEGHAVKEHEC